MGKKNKKTKKSNFNKLNLKNNLFLENSCIFIYFLNISNKPSKLNRIGKKEGSLKQTFTPRTIKKKINPLP